MKVFCETKNYKYVMLYKSNATMIYFAHNKNNRMLDRISITRLGTEYIEPKSVSICRYEDEDYINRMLNLYNSIN